MKYLVTTLVILFISLGINSLHAQDTIKTRNSVVVLPINIQVPANAKKLSTIKIGNNSTETQCAYDELVEKAKQKAAELGGNIVKIKELISPVFISKCYKIAADIYYADPLPEYEVKTDIPSDELVVTISDTAQYALVYVYRMTDTVTFQPAYNLHSGDSILCHIKSKSRTQVKIYKEGKTEFWAETERRITTHIDIQLGHIYFLRCGTVPGGMLRQLPIMELIPNDQGIKEYNLLQRKRKDLDVKYLWQIH